MSQLNQENQMEMTPAHGVEQLVIASNDPVEAENWQDEKTMLLPAAAGGRSTIWLELAQGGQRFDISCFPVTLGRHPECDIVLQGDGVSRSHASLLKVDGGYAIEDNGSLNGIRINDYAVDRVLLADGDRIGIGTVELIFHQDIATKQAKSPGKRKRILAVVTLIVALFVSGMYAQRAGYLPTVDIASFITTQSPNAILPSEESVATETVADAEAVVNDSKEAVDQSTNSAPIIADSNIIIPTSAQHANEISADEVVQVASPDTSMADGINTVTAELIVNSPVPEQKPLSVETKPQLVSKLSASSPLIQNSSGSTDQGSAKALAKSKEKVIKRSVSSERSREQILDARARYLDGEADQAFTALNAIIDSNRYRAAHRDEANQLKNQLTESYALYTSGQQAFDRGQKDQAFVDWQQFLASENALLLPQKSRYAEDVNEHVFSEYIAIADAADEQDDYHKAYQYWQRAAAIKPDSEASTEIAILDQRARTLYRDGYRKETINLTQARTAWQKVLTVVPPGTEYHTKARAKLRWYAYLDQ